MLKNDGDFTKLSDAIKKSCIKCFVKETYPKFLISDGQFFVAAYLTKEAFEKHQKQQGAIKITDLADKVMVL